MDAPRKRLEILSHIIHKRFLWLLLASYVVAGIWPSLGHSIRGIAVNVGGVNGRSVAVTLPATLLAFLLFNAGFGVDLKRLRDLGRHPQYLLVGLAANIFVPTGFIFGAAWLTQDWHNPDEIQCVILGLALVAAMPIAGSSTAWSQNANGDLALSLGLVLGSTLLSPLTTPMILKAVQPLTNGTYANELTILSGQGTGLFLGLVVLAPAVAGIAIKWLVDKRILARLRPWLKLANSASLLTLLYANACLSLPDAVAQPDFDFWLLIVILVLALCTMSFATGWLLGRLTLADEPRQTALMFGLGMNNNGTGLVLASAVLAAYPRVMLPLIGYNLVQHLVAGAVNALRGRAR